MTVVFDVTAFNKSLGIFLSKIICLLSKTEKCLKNVFVIYQNTQRCLISLLEKTNLFKYLQLSCENVRKKSHKFSNPGFLRCVKVITVCENPYKFPYQH